MHIWQQPDWPYFCWDDASLKPQLDALTQNATRHPDSKLTVEQLCQWQTMLFPEPQPMSRIRVGALRGEQPMQVVSGRLDRPRVHFEAPPRKDLEAELKSFINWFNNPPADLDPLLANTCNDRAE